MRYLRLFDDVTFGIHLCRGNQRSMWHREGSYDAIAEKLFTELRHDRFCLNTTARGPAPSSRCALCRKARSWFWDWSAPKSRRSKPSTISSAASTPRPSIFRSNSWRSAPNAALPRTWSATWSAKTIRKENWKSSSKRRGKSGVRMSSFKVQAFKRLNQFKSFAVFGGNSIVIRRRGLSWR